MTEWLPRFVARVPTSVQIKLLVAFLTIAVLLITFGIVGIQVLGGVNRRAEEMITLQRKIAAYRQLQHHIAAQLHNVTSALFVSDERTLAETLRQLNQFGSHRVQFVAHDEAELLGEVRKDYDQFTQIVTRVVDLIRAGKAVEGRELQIAQASPLADRLDRLTNQLINRAAADMVTSIETSREAYLSSQWVVIGFALGSIGLALMLGFAFSWSLIGSVKEIDFRLKQIASGDFSNHIDIPNRDELGTLAANVNRMNDELGRLYQQLETANRHKSQFLANVNHELRTPVSAIITYAGLVLSKTEGQISHLQKENLQDLLKNAERLLSLIDSLLDIATIEAGKMEVRLDPIDLEEIILEAVAAIESSVDRNHVRIIRDLAGDLTGFSSDSAKLRQIILNLLDNAAKFTERGVIQITASQQNGVLKLVVSDTGIGIHKEDMNHIFEEFGRGKSSTTKRTRGTGLGLAIVKSLAGLLGGTIDVSSKVGEGSTFTVTLPLDYQARTAAYN